MCSKRAQCSHSAKGFGSLLKIFGYKNFCHQQVIIDKMIIVVDRNVGTTVKSKEPKRRQISRAVSGQK